MMMIRMLMMLNRMKLMMICRSHWVCSFNRVYFSIKREGKKIENISG